MSYCKICHCGEKIVFERRMSYPFACPSCGRALADFETFNANIPEEKERAERLQKEYLSVKNGTTENAESKEKIFADSGDEDDLEIIQDTKKTQYQYMLQMENGKKIPIPREGGIIGRTGIGAEELAEFGSVSRNHIRLSMVRAKCIRLEDLSKYGTWIDGVKAEKNVVSVVYPNSKIQLCNVETILIKEELH